MSAQIEQYTARFEELNEEVIAATEQCTDEQWRQSSVGENWPIAVVAHHIAIVNTGFAGMVDRFANGDTYTPTTSMEEIHRMNAEHAREFANVSKRDVLDELRSGGAVMAATLRKLQDSDLERAAGVFGGNPLTVGQVVEYVVLGHTAEHLNSMRATLGGQDHA